MIATIRNPSKLFSHHIPLAGAIGDSCPESFFVRRWSGEIWNPLPPATKKKFGMACRTPPSFPVYTTNLLGVDNKTPKLIIVDNFKVISFCQIGSSPPKTRWFETIPLNVGWKSCNSWVEMVDWIGSSPLTQLLSQAPFQQGWNAGTCGVGKG